jgi:hypothetical protein
MFTRVQKTTISTNRKVDLFTTYIGVEFGLDRRRTHNILRTRKIRTSRFQKKQEEIMEPMDETDTRKYLGMLQYRQIYNTEL